MRIPEEGQSRETIFAGLEALRSDDLDWRAGRTFAYVYHAGKEAEEIGRDAYMSFLGENGLDPTVYPSMLRIESEVVGMAAEHLGGGPETVGSFTSGGTESCMLSVKTARDWGRAERGIEAPEMVLPETAHAAFHKAASYFGVKAVAVPVDPETRRARPELMEAAITERTVLLVGSAPSYAHGVVDPIEAIGRIAKARDLLFHVDGCIGAFILPYLRRLEPELPPFDLSVEGVTSISMDFHKYAYCPKPSSVILYRDKALRRYAIYACADWPGYTVVNPTMQSTKSGGPLAGTWAVLNGVGDAGFLEIARVTRAATLQIAEAIAAMEEYRLLARPDTSLICFTSDTVDVFHVIDEMKLRGWYVQPQLRYGRHPANIHLSVTHGNARLAEPFLADLREATAAARSLPPLEIPEALLAALGDLEGGGLDEATFTALLGSVGITGAVLPERMAPINALMNALSPPLREALLTAFINNLYVPPRD